MPDTLIIREAAASDVAIIATFIRELAIYEKMEAQVVVTEAQLVQSLFQEQEAYCILAFEGHTPVGFALYFYNYSTFLGRKGLYLEDLFVRPSYRGKGYGKALFLHLATIAHDQACGRMEWSVLNWNTPAIQFYQGLGATAQEGWTVYRLQQDQIRQLATQN